MSGKFHRERDAEARARALLMEARSRIVEAQLSIAKQSLTALFDTDLTVGVASAARARGLAVPQLGAPGAANLLLRGVFHPTIEFAHGGSAVANDLDLGVEARVAVVTGSNMSGKSTLLRAAVLAAWAAQCGMPICGKEGKHKKKKQKIWKHLKHVSP